MKILDFNSHAHVERDSMMGVTLLLPQNFNSHAHVERDRDSITANNVFVISTHTLTWSVTRERGEASQEVSDFNSHAHVERDRITPVGGF